MSGTRAARMLERLRVAFVLSWLTGSAFAQSPTLDTALGERIDEFVESERKALGHPGRRAGRREDGRPGACSGLGHHGVTINAETPFPIGSLAKAQAEVVRLLSESK